jgi:hypothetical protein
MTITQLIKQLEAFLPLVGDLEVEFYGHDEASPIEGFSIQDGSEGEKVLRLE